MADADLKTMPETGATQPETVQPGVVGMMTTGDIATILGGILSPAEQNKIPKIVNALLKATQQDSPSP